MTPLFRFVHACAAFLSIAIAALVVASVFIANRAPQSMEFLGVSLAVGAIFVSIGVLLFGIRRHLTAMATLATARDATGARLASHVGRLLVYLLVGGAFLCAVLGSLTYGILERIDDGFAVFG